ncbi:MAG: Uma2 family endonuclease [Planctomycetaceae bacterium]|nr:Uma2 family endonuclease [Planctomycetaceae bacterium]
MIQRSMTAEEFAQNRYDLPDAGQWSELVRGVPVAGEAPDLDHGTIVLNFSKALSAYVHETENGYPCFDLGLKVESAPDTVFFPAISYFLSGARFAEQDQDYTTTVPGLVIELLTTADRRRQISERITAYQTFGIASVWLVDPQQRTAHVVNRAAAIPLRVTEFETLRGDPILSGFSIKVAELFEEPEWAKK